MAEMRQLIIGHANKNVNEKRTISWLKDGHFNWSLGSNSYKSC